MKRQILLWFIFMAIVGSCADQKVDKVGQWQTYEIQLEAGNSYDNPYTDVDVYGLFVSNHGDSLRRPAFYDGNSTWRIRFSSPQDNALWQWKTFSSPSDAGLEQSGSVEVNPNLQSGHPLLAMSAGRRSVVRQNGKPFLVVADTPWALPFRATPDQVRHYAVDRQGKGFNTALLMSVQPDMEAEGPEARDQLTGFARGFVDLSEGHLNQLNPGYFQHLDTLIDILHAHDLVPAFQPVFHGYGWKGKKVLGNYAVPEEYVRYTRYLLARYGSKPAFWLIAGDNGGDDPGVREAGEMLEDWDDYSQPTGLHYNPCDDYIAEWAVNNPVKHCEHYNRSHQDAAWLDFQWAQTGHSNDHLYHKVERMYDNLPIKASMNGEPTYEGMNNGKNGLGWWQGEEAWMQLLSGGTMGVAYGAACLWQWKITPNEPGWPDWTNQNKSWREALALEGSTYVGLVGKILQDLDLTDIRRDWNLADGQPLLTQPGRLYISYLSTGGQVVINEDLSNLTFQWVDPRTGTMHQTGPAGATGSFTAPSDEPWVLIIS